MKNHFPLIGLLLMVFFCLHSTITLGQEDQDILKVKQLLHEQSIAWNKGDIDTFMETYWKSDRLQFIGAKGVTYGWQNTLEGYKRRYPNREAMGQLTFDIITVDKHSDQLISLVGKFMLKRSIGDLSGHFLLLIKKIDGKWLIIADHTSAEG